MYSQDELVKRAKPYLKNRDRVFITEDGNVFYVEHLGDAQGHANTQKIGLFQVSEKGIRRYGDDEHQADAEFFTKPKVDKEGGIIHKIKEPVEEPAEEPESEEKAEEKAEEKPKVKPKKKK
jgi:hypothetical protein